jgi:chemotaxis signal transduction protein
MMDGAESLARAFDAVFAAPPSPQRAGGRRYLVAIAGGRRLALRLEELAAVLPLPQLAAVPGGAPGLLGVGAVRGRAAAVFALASLLGSEVRPCRWLALLGAGAAIAVEDLDGLLDAEQAVELPASGGRIPFSTHAIADRGATLDVIDIGALAAAIAPATSGDSAS